MSNTPDQSEKILSKEEQKLILITMVRNEVDICSAFIKTNVVFFDEIYVIDHSSTDGTLESIEAIQKVHPQISIFHFKHRGYYQSEILTFFAHKAFDDGATWVFFLDTDEFLDIKSRDDLVSRLAEFRHNVMNLRWMNVIPSIKGSFEKFDLSQQFRWSGTVSTYGKVALSASYWAQAPSFIVHQGGHAVSAAVGVEPAQMVDGIRIFHVPIRSLDRLRYKVSTGIAAYNALTGRNSQEGFHWRELDIELKNGEISDNRLSGIIARYGDDIKLALPVDPISSNWEIRHIPIEGFGADNSIHLQYARSLSTTLKDDESIQWEMGGPSSPGALVQIALQGSSLVVHPQAMLGSGMRIRKRFERLNEPSNSAAVEFPSHILFSALNAAFTPIQTLVPTAWAQHVPFLFALITLMQPKRYVELGTHNGMSFFAACQMASVVQTPLECIGIDAWVGDEHAGFYGGEIFQNFRNLLSELYPSQIYIRSYFENAVNLFDDGSIDMLHVDGLHTYEAVKSDYELWLPKMSKTGVMIFHDTNVYSEGFGVWRFWNEIKLKYPHFHMPYCHGLGLIYVGEDPSPITVLLRNLEDSEWLQTLYIGIFGNLGTISTAAAHHVIRNKQLDGEVKADHQTRKSAEDSMARLQAALTASKVDISQLQEIEAIHNEEIGRYDQYVNNLESRVRDLIAVTRDKDVDIEMTRAQIGAIRRSTSWRLTLPIRVLGRMFKRK